MNYKACITYIIFNSSLPTLNKNLCAYFSGLYRKKENVYINIIDII